MSSMRKPRTRSNEAIRTSSEVPTIWTAAARSIPALDKLDVKRGPSGHASARRRAAAVKVQIARDLRAYASVPVAPSLRKLVR